MSYPQVVGKFKTSPPYLVGLLNFFKGNRKILKCSLISPIRNLKELDWPRTKDPGSVLDQTLRPVSAGTIIRTVKIITRRRVRCPGNEKEIRHESRY
jgi:hypothetical protein